ncbi:MAG: asparagine synthase C-terminal domain-containing protein [Candidatus Nitrosotenuis sp.]
MQDLCNQIYKILEESVSSCTAENLSLSGGLDSTILAYFLRERKPTAISIIARDFIANDLTYCQMAAQRFNLPQSIIMCDIEMIHDGIEETIKILKNFNDIEIRNNVVPYLAISEVKKRGFDKIITGDGADEIFAGYNFFLNKTKQELELDLKRIAKIMHFSSQKIGESLGVKVESPFCSKSVLEFAKTIPSEMLVREEAGKKYGKWILRKTFEEKIPKSIAWRQKSPMQDGAGTQGLAEFFEKVIPDSVFAERARKIKEKDGITVRTKESLHYYEVYRKYYEPDITDKSGIKCQDCHYTIDADSRFCRMCGKFPL